MRKKKLTLLTLLFQSSSDSTEFMLNWLKDIPDDPVPVENKETKWWLNDPSVSEQLQTTETREREAYPRYWPVIEGYGCIV